MVNHLVREFASLESGVEVARFIDCFDLGEAFTVLVPLVSVCGGGLRDRVGFGVWWLGYNYASMFSRVIIYDTVLNVEADTIEFYCVGVPMVS